MELQSKHLSTRGVLFIIFLILVLDQCTKYLARIFLRPGYSISILGDFFRLSYVENPGIAFGIRIDNKVLFTLLSLMAILVIFYYLFKMKDHFILRFAFAIILGGAFGNLIDRFIYGRVVDFFDFDFFNITIPSFKFLFFHFPGYSLHRWPVFNVADMAVSVGMIIVILSAILEGNHQPAEENEQTATD